MWSPLFWSGGWSGIHAARKCVGDEMVTEMPEIVTKIVTKGQKCTK